MIRFDLITLFPNLFNEFFNTLPFKRALEKEISKINIWDLRNYALDDYGSVDDKPYGGGRGMILRVEPVYNALVDIYSDYYSEKTKGNKEEINNLITKAKNDPKCKIIAFTPKGNRFSQKKAKTLSKIHQITMISGRYEGLDHRIIDELATDSISIGNYVLSGGEIPALTVMDSILRLFPGVLDADATQKESFENDLIEHPQYTRPDIYKGMKVPQVLLSGDHKKIDEWREKKKSPAIEKDHPEEQ
jgi:tRNA (guanine37-N1)-methyltransferase